MNKRVALLASFLLVSCAVVEWLQSAPGSEARPEAVNLSDVPLQTGGWTGEEFEVQDATVQVLKAQAYINRVYRDVSGSELSLHIANWTNPVTISAAPHHPDVCYPAAGWEIVERRVIQVGISPNAFPIELIQFQKGERRVVTGHWFQVGSVKFVNSEGFQRERYRFWGQQGWPDTTKFLIHVNAFNIDAAEEIIIRFAEKIAQALAADKGETDF